jgi:hypothetical protein
MSIKQFKKLYSSGRLNLEPGFQRRSVWGVQDRRRLLVSVFDGIPLPTVYVYERQSATGRLEFDVIDGKQRLETLLLFMEDGPLVGTLDPLKFRSDLHGSADLAWRHWVDLTPAQRRLFQETKIAVITVTGDFSEVAELFVRINATGKKLTGQEKRHAFHEHSNVLRTASVFAENHADFFRGAGVFSQSQLDRMLHIEFATELLLYAYNGVHQNKKRRLDAVIKGDTLEQDQLSVAVKEMTQVLRAIDCILPDLRSTRFRRRADFYTLVTLLHRLHEEGRIIHAKWSQRNDLAGDLLRRFGLEVELVSERSAKARKIPAGSETQVEYLRTVKEGTDSAAQRKRRESILERQVLHGVFDEKDHRRTFTEQQRRILWNLSRDKRCAACGKPIKTWDEMHADHVYAYVKGGKTTLGNGAITHKGCNLAKGATG